MFKINFLLIIFIILAIANIISVKNNNKLGMLITKPLLMPMLLLMYVFSASILKWFIILALIFGFLGDVFLMRAGMFFIAGLLCFLTGHVFYTAAFITSSTLPKIPFEFYILILPYILYGLLVYKKLLPHLKSMKLEVFLYLIVIIAMSFSSLLRVWNTNGYQFWLPFIGSILFIISDSILAFNNFKPEERARVSDIYIMTTYIAAQLLIVLGFI